MIKNLEKKERERILSWGDYIELSWLALYNHRGPYKKKARGSTTSFAVSPGLQRRTSNELYGYACAYFTSVSPVAFVNSV